MEKEKINNLTSKDIMFEPNDTLDFSEYNDTDTAVISEYLWATDKLVERAGFNKELENKIREKFNDEEFSFEEIIINFFYIFQNNFKLLWI